MNFEIFVPWDDEAEQLHFPCHTSVITEKLLLQKLSEEFGLEQEESNSDELFDSGGGQAKLSIA